MLIAILLEWCFRCDVACNRWQCERRVIADKNVSLNSAKGADAVDSFVRAIQQCREGGNFAHIGSLADIVIGRVA